jgi:hypothetical protein
MTLRHTFISTAGTWYGVTCTIIGCKLPFPAREHRRAIFFLVAADFFSQKHRFSWCPTMVLFNPRAAVTSGLSTNSNGGAYNNGKTYNKMKKFEQVDKEDELRILAGGVPPSRVEYLPQPSTCHMFGLSG